MDVHDQAAYDALQAKLVPLWQSIERFNNDPQTIVVVPSAYIDFELTAPRRKRCLVEVKSVTLREGRHALFPDAPSERGRRHLEELIALRRAGERAVLLFLVQRGDVRSVGPARAIDPAYGEALDAARAAGVEVLAYRAAVEPSRERIRVVAPLPLEG